MRRHGYEEPTPIQCQALPIALSGRDMIGIAATGSGKTAAFVLPALTHIMAQHELRKGDGPIALILAPTHELAEQIVKEARRFAKPLGVRCTAVFGGVGKYEQFKELKAGAELVVGTPGRLIELIGTKGALSMTRVTYVVIDEADRMFSLGFEQQVRSVVGQVRPDRQTLLFSATFRLGLGLELDFGLGLGFGFGFGALGRFGAFGHWGIGPWLVIGALALWDIGALGRWGIGALGHWRIGALAHLGIGALRDWGHWGITLTSCSSPPPSGRISSASPETC